MDLFKMIVGYSRGEPEYMKRAFRNGAMEGCLFALLITIPLALAVIFLVYVVTR